MADYVGERLKQARTRQGLSLRRLAAVAQVPVSTLSSVEAGTRQGDNLTVGTLRRLALALGVTLDRLAMRYDEEPIHG